MKATWGYTIRWTTWRGDRYEIQALGRVSRDQALAHAIAMARSMGWTPRRWWQIWRWGDTQTTRGQL